MSDTADDNPSFDPLEFAASERRVTTYRFDACNRLVSVHTGVIRNCGEAAQDDALPQPDAVVESPPDDEDEP
jgi:hypothetical protein